MEIESEVANAQTHTPERMPRHSLAPIRQEIVRIVLRQPGVVPAGSGLTE